MLFLCVCFLFVFPVLCLGCCVSFVVAFLRLVLCLCCFVALLCSVGCSVSGCCVVLISSLLFLCVVGV